jgi:hypothetical protein
MKQTSRFTILLVVLGLGIGGALGYALRGSGTDASDAPIAAWDERNRSVFAASIIRIPVSKDSRSTQALKVALRTHEQLTAGEDFATVARRVSRDPTSDAGGFMGVVPIGTDSMFTGAVQALRPGDLSMPILTKEGYMIVKRHTFEETCRLEEQLSIPAHGVFVRWESVPHGRPGVTEEAARHEAEQLVADLKAGRTTVADAAEIYMPGDQRPPGDFLGLIMDQPSSAKAFAELSKAGPGDVVGPIREPHGFAVLVRGRHLRALVRHILIQHIRSDSRDIRTSRSREEALELAKKVVAEVRADPSTWDSAVERFSDDRNNLDNGGSLGAIQVAELPAPLRNALYDTQPGTIHPEPIETARGFEIVWRVN